MCRLDAHDTIIARFPVTFSFFFLLFLLAFLIIYILERREKFNNYFSLERDSITNGNPYKLYKCMLIHVSDVFLCCNYHGKHYARCMKKAKYIRARENKIFIFRITRFVHVLVTFPSCVLCASDIGYPFEPST